MCGYEYLREQVESSHQRVMLKGQKNMTRFSLQYFPLSELKRVQLN